MFYRVPVPCSCIRCHFLSFERNEFGSFFQYSNDCVLKSRFSKQSFCWHQLDLHKSQFYNSRCRWAVFLNEHGDRMKGYINYVKLTNGKFNNSSAHEKVAFCYKKSFPWNYCVTLCRFAYLHTVTAWQAMALLSFQIKLSSQRLHVLLKAAFTRKKLKLVNFFINKQI